MKSRIEGNCNILGCGMEYIVIGASDNTIRLLIGDVHHELNDIQGSPSEMSESSSSDV